VTDATAERIELFCLEYVKHFRGSEAARAVGVSHASARSWACRALARPEVAERIEQLKAERRQTLKLEADDVARRLALVATADPNDLVEFRRQCCRYCWGLGFGYQRTDGAFRAAKMRHGMELKRMREIGADLVGELPEFDAQGGPGFDATRDPNPECPECHGQGEGVPFFHDTRDLNPAARALYAGVKVTKDGLEVRMHDPMRAAELLGRHLGMFTEKLEVNLTHKLADRMRNRVPLA
jgi:phage terminase small subunit